MNALVKGLFEISVEERTKFFERLMDETHKDNGTTEKQMPYFLVGVLEGLFEVKLDLTKYKTP